MIDLEIGLASDHKIVIIGAPERLHVACDS